MAERFVCKKIQKGPKKGEYMIPIQKGGVYNSKAHTDGRQYKILDMSTREDGEPLQVFYSDSSLNFNNYNSMNFYDFMVDIMGEKQANELFDYYDPSKTSSDTQSSNTSLETTNNQPTDKKRNTIIAIASIVAGVAIIATVSSMVNK